MAALLGDLDEAKTYFAQARDTLEKAGLRPLRAIADYDEALALHRIGSADPARLTILLEAALAQFRELRMVGWEQRTLALEAQILENSDGVVVPISSQAHSPRPRYPGGLTAREEEVLSLLAGGRTNREIAAHLVISLPTVERHIANIYHKIEARNRAEATAYAISHGLVQPHDSPGKSET
jgi:DNA-binding CsgD family transcriptional regulator